MDERSRQSVGVKVRAAIVAGIFSLLAAIIGAIFFALTSTESKEPGLPSPSSTPQFPAGVPTASTSHRLFPRRKPTLGKWVPKRLIRTARKLIRRHWRLEVGLLLVSLGAVTGFEVLSTVPQLPAPLAGLYPTISFVVAPASSHERIALGYAKVGGFGPDAVALPVADESLTVRVSAFGHCTADITAGVYFSEFPDIKNPTRKPPAVIIGIGLLGFPTPFALTIYNGKGTDVKFYGGDIPYLAVQPDPGAISVGIGFTTDLSSRSTFGSCYQLVPELIGYNAAHSAALQGLSEVGVTSNYFEIRGGDVSINSPGNWIDRRPETSTFVLPSNGLIHERCSWDPPRSNIAIDPQNDCSGIVTVENQLLQSNRDFLAFLAAAVVGLGLAIIYDWLSHLKGSNMAALHVKVHKSANGDVDSNRDVIGPIPKTDNVGRVQHWAAVCRADRSKGTLVPPDPIWTATTRAASAVETLRIGLRAAI